MKAKGNRPLLMTFSCLVNTWVISSCVLFPLLNAGDKAKVLLVRKLNSAVTVFEPGVTARPGPY